MKIQKVLILSDFSEVSFHLLTYGSALAQYLNAQVWVQHAYYIPSNVAGETLVPEDVREHYEKRIRLSFDRLKEKLPLLEEKEVSLVVNYGDLVTEMNRLIDREQIDLVMVGNHGGGFLTNILGSHTVKVIQHAHCPVLSVPKQATFHPYQRLVWATDLKPIHAETWDYLTAFVQTFQTHLDIIHVGEKSEEFEKTSLIMYSGCHTFSHRFFNLYLPDIEKGIQQHIHDYQNDLLVLLPHAHSFFDRLFQKSITRQLAFQGNIPLLTIHE